MAGQRFYDRSVRQPLCLRLEDESLEVHADATRARQRLYLVAMSFRVVFVSLAAFLVARGLVRAIAERLIFGQPAHANPDRFLLGLNFKRSLVRLNDSAHARS